jgi:nitrogen regulatory protein PII-like uncharacterized protein
MEMHRRRKLEIIVEAGIARRVETMLTEEGVSGFFVVAGREGASRGSASWSDDGLSGALEKVMITAVTNEEIAGKVMSRLQSIFERYPGVCFSSDVDIMRADRF